MKSIHLKWLEYLTGFIFIISMVAIATWLDDVEIILPEIAALTAGLWLYHEPNWVANPSKIFIIPSTTAIVGFGINLLPWTYPEKILLLLGLMVGFLSVMRSTLAPAFATGLLPIIVNARHYSFIIAILVFTLILMLAVQFRQLATRTADPLPINYRAMLVFLGLAVIWVGLVTLAGKPQMAAIPPVFVVFFEVLQKPMYSGKMAVKQVIALTGAATIGVVAYSLIDSRLLVTLIALPLVALLLWLLRVKIPAAYAFPLLAIILPTTMFHTLPLTSLLATSYFFGGAYLYHRLVKPYFQPTKASIHS
ncbi:hypothetical protein [Latilactobacillus fuchuensis]|uniref:Membrane protein n=1 Tax=Latilactobacillus fuchuensis DSM 14340 = JCM 11249 TaxID=1423747 RepID=A0A0R1RPI0_9LACO|nr:hypothetical protein [Latilactobacillus fuchuensis]KRL59149.1 membrane protein [Latilactobacillus fuchuensis DSM 14340 = JCM 11249]